MAVRLPLRSPALSRGLGVRQIAIIIAMHGSPDSRVNARGLIVAFCVLATVVPLAPTAHARSGVWHVTAGEAVVGRNHVYIAKYEDTLVDIARRFEMGLSELRLINPEVDVWLPGEGTAVRLPSQLVLPAAPRSGVVINVPEMRMYYYPEGESVVHTWPISIGRVGWETPLGNTTIVRKKASPTWYPPESIRMEHAMRGDPLPRVVRPGPENPLGSHALYLGFPEYLIHGTNKPYSIGMRVSHGCVRMYPEHIVEVFEMVNPGTPVTLIHQEVKAGWGGTSSTWRCIRASGYRRRRRVQASVRWSPRSSLRPPRRDSRSPSTGVRSRT